MFKIKDIPYEEYFCDSEEVFILLQPDKKNTIEEIESAKLTLFSLYTDLLFNSDQSETKVTILVDKQNFVNENTLALELVDLLKKSEAFLNSNITADFITDPEIRNNLGLRPDIEYDPRDIYHNVFADLSYGYSDFDWDYNVEPTTDEEKIMRAIENGDGELFGY
jgi:hypothetical protein